MGMTEKICLLFPYFFISPLQFFVSSYKIFRGKEGDIMKRANFITIQWQQV